MTKWLSLYIQHSYMLLHHKRPATPPQLLHEWPTLRNFATVKQKLKINSLGRKKFFPGQEKMTNVECGMLNGRRIRWKMKNELIQHWIIQIANSDKAQKLNYKHKLKTFNTQHSNIQHRQRWPFLLRQAAKPITTLNIQHSIIPHRQRRPFNIQHSTFNTLSGGNTSQVGCSSGGDVQRSKYSSFHIHLALHILK